MDGPQAGSTMIRTLADGEIQGHFVGSNVSVIVIDTEVIGYGPALHSHPYPETFVVLTGNVVFIVDDERIDASAGAVVVAPAHAAHRFENVGPGRLLQIDIHGADRFDTRWLES